MVFVISQTSERKYKMLNFALIGAAGYIAPRHMAAIKATNNRLVAAYDPNDSVGIIDSYFPEANFFTEFERFDRFVDKYRREAKGINYFSICSPNYLHDSHIRFALRSGANAICEKPLVLNSWNIDALIDYEKETGKKVNTILQLRVHPSIISLKKTVEKSQLKEKFDIDLTYITSRGKWYLQSWKGDESKSGGIATNIGVHFFDMLHFVFGELQENKVGFREETKASGYLEYQNARVRWFLSTDYFDIPLEIRETGARTYRSLSMNGSEIEFSKNFTDLHTVSYEEILNGRGFGLMENRVAIETVAAIRSQGVQTLSDTHPLLRLK